MGCATSTAVAQKDPSATQGEAVPVLENGTGDSAKQPQRSQPDRAVGDKQVKRMSLKGLQEIKRQTREILQADASWSVANESMDDSRLVAVRREGIEFAARATMLASTYDAAAVNKKKRLTRRKTVSFNQEVETVEHAERHKRIQSFRSWSDNMGTQLEMLDPSSSRPARSNSSKLGSSAGSHDGSSFTEQQIEKQKFKPQLCTIPANDDTSSYDHFQVAVSAIEDADASGPDNSLQAIEAHCNKMMLQQPIRDAMVLRELELEDDRLRTQATAAPPLLKVRHCSAHEAPQQLHEVDELDNPDLDDEAREAIMGGRARRGAEYESIRQMQEDEVREAAAAALLEELRLQGSVGRVMI